MRLTGSLNHLVGGERLRVLAQWGLRGEVWYPVPVVLRSNPLLLGYYRLLYGLSKKAFYKDAPFKQFAALEESGRLTARNETELDRLCSSLIETAGQLLSGVQPVSMASVRELQLLTVGPQFRGGENNRIGQKATGDIFDLIRESVRACIDSEAPGAIVIRNAAGRLERIAFAADPDIAFTEQLSSGPLTNLSIEIKGGADDSNVHNRLGEAEKSHLKAKSAGCTQFWTVLNASVDLHTARRESPTTTHFFHLPELLAAKSQESERFAELVRAVLGIV